MLDSLVTQQMEYYFGHAAGWPVLGPLKDDVLHLRAAQVFDLLLAQHPGNGVGDVALAAAVRADDGGDSVPCKDYLGVVGEGFETGDL